MFKKIRKNKKGSALLMVVFIFFIIAVLSFGSGYLIFLNYFRASDVSDNMKAYYAAKAGIERAHFEVIKNNFDFSDPLSCSADVFSGELDNGSSYYINCFSDSPLQFNSVGVYNKSRVSLGIDCIVVTEDCLDSCLVGSFCGGGKLYNRGGFNLVVSPSGCDAVFSCDNSFLTDDSMILPWEVIVTPTFWGATSMDNGVSNIVTLNPQVNTDILSAKYCDDLVWNGYDDWYLPSAEEIKIFVNFPSDVSYFNIATTSNYWTSTEIDASNAYSIDMVARNYTSSDKTENYLTRCVRPNN
ncbi:MAG: DUF1566 domain-containing protein [Patescibacteria group bacterium]|jgi:hypothetical protein